tara:strand:- start:903 stop:1127 length:225 start_codon:yes stop_codon:yes gene_type:complete
MISFEDWYDHYSPLVEYLYYEFLSICYNRGVELINSESAYNDFAYTLYNTSKNYRLLEEELWPSELNDDEDDFY